MIESKITQSKVKNQLKVHSNRYVFLYTLTLTTIVAVVLAFLATSLKPLQDKNEALFKKKDILTAVDAEFADADDSVIEETFAKVQQFVLDAEGNVVKKQNAAGEEIRAEDLDMKKEEKKAEADRQYPLYVYNHKGKDLYVVSARGNGLWDKIWGSFALEDDFRTIAGATFDHTGETPGLGAEIKDNSDWKKKFVGDKIYNDETGQYLVVKKGGETEANKDYEVDAISGATVTCDGVTDMIANGMAPYFAYFKNK